MYSLGIYIAKVQQVLRLLTFMALLLAHTDANGEESDTVTIKYRINSAAVDTAYMDNRMQLQKFYDLLCRNDVDTIFVLSSASPDGRKSFNEKLRAMRVGSIIAYMKATCRNLDGVCFVERLAPIGWDNLFGVLPEDSLSAFSSDLLQLLASADVSDNEKQRRLRGNRVLYRRMADRWLPMLRYAKCAVSYRGSLPQSDGTAATTADSTARMGDGTPLASVAVARGDSCCGNLRWHISTNLIYWAALAHNVGIEYDLDDRRTVLLSGACAWWSNLRRHRVYRWMAAEAAYRHYFGSGLPHSGFFVGAYLQAGLFEMMFSSKNRKGEFLSGGVSGGYSWRVADHWSLTPEIGVGYMAAKYRYATDIDGTLIRQGSSHRRFFGPTRLALSLTYNFIKNRRSR